MKITNRCNIDCDYCYVFHSPDEAWRNLPVRMAIDTAILTASRVAEHSAAHGVRRVNVVLHGGEPLLAGRKHIDQMLAAFRQAIPSSVSIDFVVQTNGILIDEHWLDIFERHQVKIGVSLDGPPEANDRHRLSHRGRSTSGAVERALDHLRARPHLFAGILAVVDLANDPADVYNYLSSFDAPVLDFNLPHATHDNPPLRRRKDLPEYGMWLSKIYDMWVNKSKYTHSIRILEDIIALTLGARGSVEALGLAAPGIAVVESDGSIESIDTLRITEQGASQLGLTVHKNSFDDALAHSKMQLRSDGLSSLAAECQRCRVVDVCGGGYLPHRFSRDNGYRNASVYCMDLLYIIDHIQSSLMNA